MQRVVLCALALSVAAGAAVAQSASKPGLWEITMHKQVINGQDITARTQEMQQRMKAAQQQMAAAMKNLSPEQRKQMEQRMGASMAAEAGNGAQRICLTAESLKSRGPGDVHAPPGARCEQGPLSRSGNAETFSAKCTYKDGTTSEVRGRRTILSENEVRTQLTTKTLGGARAGDMEIDSTAKWVGADCGTVKPLEQLAREARAVGDDAAEDEKPPPKAKR